LSRIYTNISPLIIELNFVFTISLFIKQIEFKSVYTSGYQTSCRTDFFTALTVGLAIERKKCRITGKCRQGKGRSTDQKDEKKKKKNPRKKVEE
jgi:hypothetical protein